MVEDCWGHFTFYGEMVNGNTSNPVIIFPLNVNCKMAAGTNQHFPFNWNLNIKNKKKKINKTKASNPIPHSIRIDIHWQS